MCGARLPNATLAIAGRGGEDLVRIPALVELLSESQLRSRTQREVLGSYEGEVTLWSGHHRL